MFFLLKNSIKKILSKILVLKLSLFGKNIKIGSRVYISKDSKLYGDNLINDDTRFIRSSIGKYSYISPQSIIINSDIGNYTSIGPGVRIGLGVHPVTENSTSPYIYNDMLFKKCRNEDFDQVNIGHDCWIGANVCILGGVKVGNGVVIGAGSIITKDIPDFAIVVGVPGKIIKYRFSEDKIKWLNDISWWNKNLLEAKRLLKS